VLPILVPKMTYEEMEVADGQAAERTWLSMLNSDDFTDRRHFEAAMRAYCQQDSRAMFELRQVLLRRA